MAIADSQANAVILHASGEGNVELAGTVVTGDILGYSSGWKRALATVAGVIQGRCVAGENGVSGQMIKVYFDLVVMDNRLSGGTAGAALYVAEGTSNGMYTETIPTTTGDATKVVGYMITPTIAAITPLVNDDSVA